MNHHRKRQPQQQQQQRKQPEQCEPQAPSSAVTTSRLPSSSSPTSFSSSARTSSFCDEPSLMMPETTVTTAATTWITTTTTTTTSRPRTATRVGTLVDAFDQCLVAVTSNNNNDSDTAANTTAQDIDETDEAENDIDLDRLLAACRVFSENMHAVGQHGNARDLAQNIVKVEQARAAFAVHQASSSASADAAATAPARPQTLSSSSSSLSSSMRALLEYEINVVGVRQRRRSTSSRGDNDCASTTTTTNTPTCKLKNPSGALGLLWMRRAVAFQHVFHQYLALMLQQQQERKQERKQQRRRQQRQQQQQQQETTTTTNSKNVPRTMVQAALNAYAQELEPYHSWPLRQIFRLAFHTTTPSRLDKALLELWGTAATTRKGEKEIVITKKLDERQHDLILEQLQELADIWNPLLKAWTSIFESLHLEDPGQA